jgi:hypothetical protein
MLTTRHPLDFLYSTAALEPLRYDAHDHDVVQGGHNDVRLAFTIRRREHLRVAGKIVLMPSST